MLRIKSQTADKEQLQQVTMLDAVSMGTQVDVKTGGKQISSATNKGVKNPILRLRGHAD